jgi:hypothetical protein
MAGYESWIDRQIREAQERGEFDNLRGAGQPIPGLGGREDENWWVKGLLERENLRPPLPGSLLLRNETVEIADTVADCVTEDQVREIVRDLNTRILNARRRGIDGPNIVIPNVDVDRVVHEWRERRRAS